MARKSKSKSSRQRPSGNSATLPTKEQILEFVQATPGKVGKREIARAFGIKGGARIPLKRLLTEMAAEGLISGPRKRIAQPGELPPVGVIRVTGRDEHGDLIARPENWDSGDSGEPPQILLLIGKRSPVSAPGIGDRLLARLRRIPLSERDGGPSYEARPIKRLAREAGQLLGIFRALSEGGVIDPVDRKHLKEWSVSQADTGEAKDGELVRFELAGRGKYGVMRARVADRLGDPEAQGAISLIAIHQHGLRDTFPEAALREADALKAPTPEDREDLRQVPLITIDPADARDHDDAVWAAPDSDPANKDGWIVIVAIADVAWSVRSGSALDREAAARGNSVYFPDRVVPMLPEAISADLCSLRDGVDRACMAVRMVFDKQGAKKSHRFLRAIMRSAASLSYSQAQDAIDGRGSGNAETLLEPVLKPLWGAYAALAAAREEREPLDLDLPERKVLLGDDGRITDIVTPPRLEAHRLIEEFMIQANVAAAETLEAQRTPLVYRIHEAPSKEKLEALSDFLETLDIRIPKTGVLTPKRFNEILAKAKNTELTELVSEVVLRSQSQAEYSPVNSGHFGLNLRRYAHFTSPIRRYADLLVHRALIRALNLGDGKLTDGEISRLEEISEQISQTERTAMAAERQTVDRLIAAYLADRIGATFTARISGVVRSGLFVRLKQTGADGFVSASSIIGDFYRQDERHQALVGDRTGLTYRLGDTIEVRLVEAIASAGALRFEMLSDGSPMSSAKRRGPARKGKKSHRKKRPGRARR